MRISTPKRQRKSSKRIDLTDLCKVLERMLLSGRVWVEHGVVRKQEGAAAHWERKDDDILVDVLTMPAGQHLTCRLGAAAGGTETGLWRVPAEGTEVIVASPMGRRDFLPTIVVCKSTAKAPDGVDTDRTILQAPDELDLVSPAVKLGSRTATQAIIKGTAYRADETNMLSLLQGWITAMDAIAASATGPSAPEKAAVVTASGLLGTALSNFGATSYLSTVSKTE